MAAYATFCTIRGASLTLGVQKPDTAAALLSILNKTIFDTGHGEILMTMLLLVIDPATSTISLANAAHPFLLHLKKEGDDALYQAEFRGVPGDLLGMSETWQGETLQITVQPHDLIAIYTDGITENPNHENKRLSNRKLREFVAAMANAKEEPLDQKLQEWYERFLGEVVLKDDSTMVLLTFDHQSEKGALQKKSAA